MDMKVNVGIITEDVSWLTRLEEKLTDSQLVIHSFGSKDHALSKISDMNIKVLLVDRSSGGNDEVVLSADEIERNHIGKNVLDFNLDAENALNHKIALGYLVNDSQIEFIDDSPTVAKYYRIDEFERQVMKLFQSVIGNMKLRRRSSGTKVLNVTSPAGGVGSTTVAVALSRALTNAGNRTLYIELGRYMGFDVNQNSPHNFSDIIFAIKMKKSNLGLAIDSVIQQNSVTGVYFIAPSPNAYDMQEITDAELASFIETVFTLDYDYIVFDSAVDHSDTSKLIMNTADVNIIVSSGTDTSKSKVSRFFETIQRFDELQGTYISDTLALVYNQFGSTDQMLAGDVPVLGGINKFQGYSEAQVLQEVTSAKMPAVVSQLVEGK
jgi:cellulose biosynthesis protein BcsQ